MTFPQAEKATTATTQQITTSTSSLALNWLSLHLRARSLPARKRAPFTPWHREAVHGGDFVLRARVCERLRSAYVWIWVCGWVDEYIGLPDYVVDDVDCQTKMVSNLLREML
jgi:hypothetical protein